MLKQIFNDFIYIPFRRIGLVGVGCINKQYIFNNDLLSVTNYKVEKQNLKIVNKHRVYYYQGETTFRSSKGTWK